MIGTVRRAALALIFDGPSGSKKLTVRTGRRTDGELGLPLTAVEVWKRLHAIGSARGERRLRIGQRGRDRGVVNVADRIVRRRAGDSRRVSRYALRRKR